MPAIGAAFRGAPPSGRCVATGRRHRGHARAPRTAGGGTALAGGSGFLLVGDGSRGETQLLWTTDMTTWEVRAAWPDVPCCGG